MERDDEVELLESMFPEEMVLTDGDLYSFQLELKVADEEDGEPETPLQLVCRLPAGYPEALGAELSVRCGRCDRAGLSSLREARDGGIHALAVFSVRSFIHTHTHTRTHTLAGLGGVPPRARGWWPGLPRRHVALRERLAALRHCGSDN